MIVTLTPNPSLDRTIEIPELHRGEVHRATGGRVDPGGKGVNVSRALAANDVATVTVLPSGGPEGAPLVAAVDAGPDLIKPNAEELAELVGRPLRRLGDVVEACTEIRKRGVATVLVSLGGDGALLVNADEVLHGWAPPVKVRSTVGAGDSTLAGFLPGGGGGRAAPGGGVRDGPPGGA